MRHTHSHVNSVTSITFAALLFKDKAQKAITKNLTRALEA